MANTNLVEMPWIPVRYLDGTENTIGIRKIFEDAEKIKEVKTPVFRGESLHLYKMLAVRFLSAVVMSAYYKEETGFAAKTLDYTEELKKNGLYSDVIQNYLDRWYDRFDLYSDQYPFLQNIALRDLPTDGWEGKFRAWNPFAPSDNNKLFGRIRSIDPEKKDVFSQFDMSKEEFPYFLLYAAAIGASPCGAQYGENALGKGEYVFVEIEGSNLAETILSNVFSLERSSRPDEDNEDVLPDLPTWELGYVSQVNEMNPEVLPDNHLLCAFYPAISMLCVKRDENDNPLSVIRLAKKRHEGTPAEKLCADQEMAKKLSEIYVDPRSIVKEKGGYYVFNMSYSTAQVMCMIATESVGGHLSSRVLEELPKDTDHKINIYYRELDKYKALSGSAGVLDGGSVKTWRTLVDPQMHEVAKKYQKYNGSAREIIRRYLKEALLDYRKKEVDKKTVLSSSVNDGFLADLSDWVEDDFFGVFTEDLVGKNDALAKAADRMIERAACIFDKYTKSNEDITRVMLARSKMMAALNKEKEKVL